MDFDFRMDKFSYLLIALILGTFLYFMYAFTGGNWGRTILYSLLMSFGLIAVSCIPVVIICYVIKRIPDIDYAVWFASAVTVIGIISEVIA